MCKSNLPFIPVNDYSEFIRWNEWPVGIAHNYTALFRSILAVLSPFSFWKFIDETYKFSRFSYSVVIFSSHFPTYRLVFRCQ